MSSVGTSPARDANLLIVSDVHLCTPRHVAVGGAEDAFASFVDHHTSAREDDTPWRLILAGDVFDFDHQARTHVRRGEVLTSLALLSSLGDRTASVLQALARFLIAGNELVVIPGNHDMDLHHALVQQGLLELLVRHAGSDQIRGSVRFCPWFYAEPGRIWVEHGHQYDAECSVAGVLAPFDPDGALQMSFASCWITDFCAKNVDLGYVVDHTLPGAAYVPLIWRMKGLLGMLGVAWDFFSFAMTQLWDCGPLHVTRSSDHGAERARLADRWGVDERAIAEIERLMATPILSSRLATARRLQLVPGGQPAERSHARRLVETAEQIASLAAVPVVVMGHVHHAERLPIGAGHYLNAGTWIDRRLPYHFVSVTGGGASLGVWR